MTTWNAWEATALLGSKRFDAVLVGEHPPEVKTGELLKKLKVGHQRIPCIVMQSAARHPFEAQFLCARGAYAVTPKWNRKGLVEQIRQSLRHSKGGVITRLTETGTARLKLAIKRFHNNLQRIDANLQSYLPDDPIRSF